MRATRGEAVPALTTGARACALRPAEQKSNVWYVSIPAPVPIGKYYITLVGTTDAVFSILVTGSETLLVDGAGRAPPPPSRNVCACRAGKGQVARTSASGNHFFFGMSQVPKNLTVRACACTDTPTCTCTESLPLCADG